MAKKEKRKSIFVISVKNLINRSITSGLFSRKKSTVVHYLCYFFLIYLCYSFLICIPYDPISVPLRVMWAFYQCVFVCVRKQAYLRKRMNVRLCARARVPTSVHDLPPPWRVARCHQWSRLFGTNMEGESSLSCNS